MKIKKEDLKNELKKEMVGLTFDNQDKIVDFIELEKIIIDTSVQYLITNDNYDSIIFHKMLTSVLLNLTNNTSAKNYLLKLIEMRYNLIKRFKIEVVE